MSESAVARVIRAKLVQEARRLVGAPFVHAGRDPATGLDCVGLILLPAQEAGICHYEVANYSEQFDPGFLHNCLARNLDRIDIPWAAEEYRREGLPSALAGDVLLFASRGLHAAHLAYATGDGTMIHAQAKSGRGVIEEPIGEVWAKMVVAVWRWPVFREV